MQPSETYNPLAKTFHWLTVLLVFGLIFVGAMMGDVEDQALRGALYTTHKTCGILVLLITILRVLWRHRAPPPPLPVTAMPGWQVKAARFVHAVLYLLLFLIPLSGWAMVSMGPYGIQLFGLIPFPNLPLGGLAGTEGFSHAVKESHEMMAGLITALVIVHIGGAIMHHFVDRDDVLLRMSPVCLHGWLKRIREA